MKLDKIGMPQCTICWEKWQGSPYTNICDACIEALGETVPYEPLEIVLAQTN